ncbi:MAG: HNH endonuclease [bacterium]|nr:HNH endonuclease [bacterium]MDE0417931.1 HNH endonuclease [bacterium]
MGIRIVVAVTDSRWFAFLRRRPDLGEVNFWSRSATDFKALQPGELFLFKLKAPVNLIVGGGIYTHSSTMPLSLAWEAFGEANGAGSLDEVRDIILDNRKGDAKTMGDIRIGCRILTRPFFFEEWQWMPPPTSFSPNIVRFKGFDTDTFEGRRLWDQVSQRMNWFAGSATPDEAVRFGKPRIIPTRLGQGAFRLVVTDAYQRRCAVTGERTLPVLDAAHIHPYSEGGPHSVSNGLLLRRDLHKLFDDGYVTVAPDLRFEVSRRIRDDYENGRAYYALQGKEIHRPVNSLEQPDRNALAWHNDNRYLG